MSAKNKEKILELQSDLALFGLDAEELIELEELGRIFPELWADNSLELTAGAINLSALGTLDEMPAHLRSKIITGADTFFRSESAAEETQKKILNFQPKLREAASTEEDEELSPVRIIEFKPQTRSWNNWLGWGVAAAACLLLTLNLVYTRVQTPTERANLNPTPEILSIGQQREQLLREPDIVKANWTEPNPKRVLGITGDVVWSNKSQKGFLLIHGLPKNDKNAETYQLWIFDANQDEKTPIDGGVFDAAESNGDLIIPIDAKIRVSKPALFAVTAEKPGGVVVSKREKLVMLAKLSV